MENMDSNQLEEEPSTQYDMKLKNEPLNLRTQKEPVYVNIDDSDEEEEESSAMVNRILASQNVIESTLDFFEGPFPAWLQTASIYSSSKSLYQQLRGTSIGNRVAPSLETLCETCLKRLAEFALPSNVEIGEEVSEEDALNQLRYLSTIDQFVCEILRKFDGLVESGKDEALLKARDATEFLVEKAVAGTERVEDLIAQLVEILSLHIQEGLNMIDEYSSSHPEITETISKYLSFAQSLVPESMKSMK